jgi:two-component system, OmpR family, phosphate regulon response regulator PhoB
MTISNLKRRFVLVLEDVRETATLIRSLLTSSGFRVVLAADEQDAITRARAEPPDVVVISLGLETEQLIAVADRIRVNAGMAEQLPIVIFCVPSIPEGSEIEVHAKTYLVRPNDFNQLRSMLGRLLAAGSGV